MRELASRRANESWAVSFPLLSGDRGTEQTIELIRSVVSQSTRDPLVRETSGAILQAVPAHNSLAEVRAIYDWVLRNIRFTKDPVDRETVSTARWILTHRFGDCDDINAVLLPSLLGTVGYPTRLITISADPNASHDFTHIYAEVLINGQWIPVDAARPGARFGAAPSRYFRKRIWELFGSGYQDVKGLNGYTVSQGLGASFEQIVGAAATATSRIIAAVRAPSAQLSPVLYQQPTYQYQTPPYSLPSSTTGFDTGTLLTWGLIFGGVLLLIKAVK